jgi:hypothetical protein
MAPPNRMHRPQLNQESVLRVKKANQTIRHGLACVIAENSQATYENVLADEGLTNMGRI